MPLAAAFSGGQDPEPAGPGRPFTLRKQQIRTASQRTPERAWKQRPDRAPMRVHPGPHDRARVEDILYPHIVAACNLLELPGCYEPAQPLSMLGRGRSGRHTTGTFLRGVARKVLILTKQSVLLTF